MYNNIVSRSTISNANIHQQLNQVPNMQPQVAQRTAVSKPINVYYQMTTKNKSFLDMHHYLESIGIKNNKFMLALLDPDLNGINPFDPNLNLYYQQKIIRECICNYW